MRLLETERFEMLFEPLKGKHVGFVALDGNVGDAMSHRATGELFDHFGISWRPLSVTTKSIEDPTDDIDHIVLSGGGNMGQVTYPIPWEQRQVVRSLDLPITIFPQSFVTDDEDTTPYARVYVREIQSQKLDSRFELAPDMALGLKLPPLNYEVTAKTGVFLREDCERSQHDHTLSLGDPAEICATVDEYVALAAKFEKIVTDRLHFCIAGLMLGRDVTLLPNSYFKNRAMYDSWLNVLGCNWRDDTKGIVYDKTAAASALNSGLGKEPEEVLAWSMRPRREKGHVMEHLEDKTILRHADGMHIAECDETTFIVWQLSDGSRSIEEVVKLLSQAYPEARRSIARDTLTILRTLRDSGAIVFADPSGGISLGAHKLERPATREKHARGKTSLAIKLNILPPVVKDQQIRLSARLYTPDTPSQTLWFETDARLSPALTRTADPFVLASLMHAMQQGRPLEVRGAQVSSGLMKNLEEFQRAWSSWRTSLHQIQICADEQDEDLNGIEQEAVAGFSGGVDSCYTIYRHLVSPDGQYNRKLKAALMIHGFDIPLSEQTQFNAALQRSQRTLEGLGIDLLTVRTNIKSLSERSLDWLDRHGLVLGSALTLFSEGFGAGIMAGTMPYIMLIPLGSNPVTDWLMGSRHFEIVHHGAHVSRLEKVRAISKWPAAVENLRVCWQGPKMDRNCGVCPKCVLTQLQFWAIGAVTPCFNKPLNLEVVRNALAAYKFSRLDWVDIHAVLHAAQQHNCDAPWLPFLEEKLARTGQKD